MDSLLDFSGRTAIVTGAASGFGALLSKELYARGANVVMGDIDTERVERLAAELNTDSKPRCIAVECDVSKESDCKMLVDTTLAAFGKLDIAVNNAGVAHRVLPLHEITESIMDKQYNINLKSVLLGMKYQIPSMVNSGGAILNVSSIGGISAAAGAAAYGAAKHGVIGLTKTAAREYAGQNIRVNAICPFFSPTNIGGGILKEQSTEASFSTHCPMKRFGQVEEIVNSMLLILSPGNSYMTGQAITIDGGVSS
jgi:NAD(P)-dependent dehydrogenase (short-subunit alcohol dehydrogenase family)